MGHNQMMGSMNSWTAFLLSIEHLNDLEMEGKDIMPKTTIPPKQMMKDHPKEIKQSANRQKEIESLVHKHIFKILSTQQDQDKSSRDQIDFASIRTGGH